jgi:hypothetical protein
MIKKLGLLYALLITLCIGCGQDVKFLEIAPMKIEFHNSGETRALIVKATDAKGRTVTELPVFTFSSENPAVADVGADGVVSAKGNGNVAIITKAPNGISGEVFVSVCLPKELICEPKDQLNLHVDMGEAVKCHVVNCKDEVISKPEISFDVVAKNIAVGDKVGSSSFQEGVMSFPVTGSTVGDTEVKVVAYNMTKTIRVHVEKALVIPGEAEYLAKNGGGKKKGGGGKKKSGNDDPDSATKTGNYGNMLKNMKF